jgi:hypothetical protein
MEVPPLYRGREFSDRSLMSVTGLSHSRSFTVHERQGKCIDRQASIPPRVQLNSTMRARISCGTRKCPGSCRWAVLLSDVCEVCRNEDILAMKSSASRAAKCEAGRDEARSFGYGFTIPGSRQMTHASHSRDDPIGIATSRTIDLLFDCVESQLRNSFSIVEKHCWRGS